MFAPERCLVQIKTECQALDGGGRLGYALAGARENRYGCEPRATMAGSSGDAGGGAALRRASQLSFRGTAMAAAAGDCCAAGADGGLAPRRASRSEPRARFCGKRNSYRGDDMVNRPPGTGDSQA